MYVYFIHNLAYPISHGQNALKSAANVLKRSKYQRKIIHFWSLHALVRLFSVDFSIPY